MSRSHGQQDLSREAGVGQRLLRHRAGLRRVAGDRARLRPVPRPEGAGDRLAARGDLRERCAALFGGRLFLLVDDLEDRGADHLSEHGADLRLGDRAVGMGLHHLSFPCPKGVAQDHGPTQRLFGKVGAQRHAQKLGCPEVTQRPGPAAAEVEDPVSADEVEAPRPGVCPPAPRPAM
jgi:hypothetical protein